MKTPREIYIDALRFDHNIAGNAVRFFDALEAEGYVIVRKADRSHTPETTRLYANLGDVSASRRAR